MQAGLRSSDEKLTITLVVFTAFLLVTKLLFIFIVFTTDIFIFALMLHSKYYTMIQVDTMNDL